MRVHYRIDGPANTPEDAPWLVFSNSLGADLSMWDAQVAALSGTYRVLRYDSRGHGRTDVAPGDYTIEQLGRDVVELMDGLGIKRASFCGLSMGGMVGMWLGVHHGERLEKLVLCNTAAKIGTADLWNMRIEAIRQGGLAPMADPILERWFTPAFAAAHPDRIEQVRQMLLRTRPEGYASCCVALRDADLRETIAQIKTPTLVIAGSKDPATPAADGKAVADWIGGAAYLELDSAHLSNIEAEAAFTEGLRRFL